MKLRLLRWSGTESNRRHEDFQSSALPTELPDRSLMSMEMFIKDTNFMSRKFCKLFLLICFCLVIYPLFAAHAWDYYLKKGSLEYQHARYNDALENLNRALQLNPASYQAANLLGNVYLSLKKYNKALHFFSLSLSLNKNQDAIHITVAELQQIFFETDSAIDHCTFVLQRKPRHAYAHINLARLFALKNDRKNAAYHFKQAYTINKQRSIPLKQEASAAQSEGKILLATELLEKALKENRADTEAYFQLALLYRTLGKPGKAIVCLEQLKYYRPYFEKTYIQIAHLYYTSRIIKSRKKELDLALKNILTAIKLNPDNDESYEFLSSLYRTLGKKVEAAEAAHRAEALSRKKASQP
jgi:tetratricopeptide (TPR) repeat protein